MLLADLRVLAGRGDLDRRHVYVANSSLRVTRRVCIVHGSVIAVLERRRGLRLPSGCLRDLDEQIDAIELDEVEVDKIPQVRNL